MTAWYIFMDCDADLDFFLTLATIENNLKQNKKQKQTQK